METLLEILTQYAEEALIPRFLGAYSPQFPEAELHAAQLTEKLESLSPEAKVCVKQLTLDLATLSACREQAYLLSGISVGLALGRL